MSVPSPPPDGQQASHKEESRKLKAFIVKMKKELAEAKERVSVFEPFPRVPRLLCHP